MATASLWVEGCVTLGKWRVVQDEHDVILNPVFEVADRQQDAFALVAASPILTEASGECLYLLDWLKFRQ
jgi:hypothetical protein